MKWPNMESLSVKLWSMRTISCRTFVGVLLPPMNCVPLVGKGKIPAARSEDAFGETRQEGITLPGKGEPSSGTGATPPGQFAPQPTTFVGVWIGIDAGKTAPVPGPFASGYWLASGTVWFRI